MKIASGRSNPSRQVWISASSTSSSGVPKRWALSRMVAARAGFCSTAMARVQALARIHSMATEPAPPPKSHNSAPGNGPSRARVAARTSARVIWPSLIKASSGRPGICGQRAASGPARHSTAMVLKGSKICDAPAVTICSAVVAWWRSSGPPICSSTCTMLKPNPRPTRRAATSCGDWAPPARISTLARG